MKISKVFAMADLLDMINGLHVLLRHARRAQRYDLLLEDRSRPRAAHTRSRIGLEQRGPLRPYILGLIHSPATLV